LIVGLLDRIRMGDLSVWVGSSSGGGTPESSRLAAAMELHQAQKEAMAPQQAPPLFLDFSHGGNQIKQNARLGSADFVFLGALLFCFRMVKRSRGFICWVVAYT